MIKQIDISINNALNCKKISQICLSTDIKNQPKLKMINYLF